jgi:hypothetical protein
MEGRRRRCAVCGGDELDRDEVLDDGVLVLATCLRCAHRWTERPARPALRAGREEEVAVAA